MAGSIKWVVYTSDSGTEYAVRLDESNTEINGFGFRDFTPDDVGTVQPLPRGYEMRYVYVLHPPTGARRKLYVGSPTASPFTLGGVVELAVQLIVGQIPTLAPWAIMSAVGEQVRRLMPGAMDTGLTDGDVS